MSNSKNYNSIVFLTVYLGLVLVGGSAQVLAQAATPRLFDIKTEIEFKDNLDDKPDENPLFVQSVVKLIEQLEELSKTEDFNWNTETVYEIEDFEFCEEESGIIATSVTDGSINRKVDFELLKTAAEIAEILFTETSQLNIGEKYDRKIDYKFSFSKNSLDFQAKVKFDNERDARLFGNHLLKKTSPVSGTLKKGVAKNTTVISKNDQVFIVTRLPRASIDELLAKNNAQ